MFVSCTASKNLCSRAVHVSFRNYFFFEKCTARHSYCNRNRFLSFLLQSYRNRFGGGLILFINENIPCKPLQEHVHLPNFEVIATEFYENNQKWFLLGLYKPPNQKTSNLIQNLSLILDLFLKNYGNLTLTGDFNVSSDDVPLESFLQACNLTILIKEASCFQSSNPSCIDLISTSQ